jgi:hypothetical protein
VTQADLVEEGFLVREVQVDRGRGDPDDVGDGPDGDPPLVPGVDQELLRRGEDLVAQQLTLPAPGP